MGCHMCWIEYYRLCRVKSKQERERRGAIKVRVKELMDMGLMYGQAIWQATWEVYNATTP